MRWECVEHQVKLPLAYQNNGFEIEALQLQKDIEQILREDFPEQLHPHLRVKVVMPENFSREAFLVVYVDIHSLPEDKKSQYLESLKEQVESR